MKTIKNYLAVFLIAAICSLCQTQIILASMSDGQALAKARSIWGDRAMIGKIRQFGDNNWSTPVGFASPGCYDSFTKVGIGFNTWDSAFAAMPADKAIKGTYSGIRFLHSTAPSDAMLPGTHTQIPGALTASTIQFLLDGNPVGDVTPLIYNSDRTAWQVDVQWDSTTVPDGFHVLCAALFHSDGAMALTNASMIVVKQ